jgi:hypothetical protein
LPTDENANFTPVSLSHDLSRDIPRHSFWMLRFPLPSVYSTNDSAYRIAMLSHWYIICRLATKTGLVLPVEAHFFAVTRSKSKTQRL